MAHYAFLDGNNIVTEVIVGREENEVVDGITDWEAHYGEFRGQTCLRTSYNTVGNQHLLGGTPFRGNYAGIGYRYDDALDVFIPPQPFPSWTLDQATFQWAAPVAYPDDGLMYNWDEASQSWQEVTDGL
jgi:hypothetical protein